MTLFFFDDFETDDFSLWDTDASGADLFTSGASALAGSFGCEVASGCFGCGDEVILDLTSFTISTAFRVGFMFNRNDLSLTSAQYIELVNIVPMAFGAILEIRVINDVGAFEVHAVHTSDGGSTDTLEAVITAGTKKIEVRIVRATTAVASDGSAELYIDASLIDSATGLDNFDRFGDLADGTLDISPNQNNNDASSGSMYLDDFTLRDDDTPIFPGAETDEYSIAPMTKPVDIDANGVNLYIAALDSLGFPVLIKILADLSAIGSLVFEPGSGTNIGVQCGAFDADVIWIAGNFGSTNVVEKSEDAGSTFVVKDNATIGNVKSFIMGPDSDNRILVFDETNGDILETVNDGGLWTTINASVTPEIAAMGRLGVNVQETVFGNDSAVSDNVDYSVNSGADLEDTNLPV